MPARERQDRGRRRARRSVPERAHRLLDDRRLPQLSGPIGVGAPSCASGWLGRCRKRCTLCRPARTNGGRRRAPHQVAHHADVVHARAPLSGPPRVPGSGRSRPSRTRMLRWWSARASRAEACTVARRVRPRSRGSRELRADVRPHEIGGGAVPIACVEIEVHARRPRRSCPRPRRQQQRGLAELSAAVDEGGAAGVEQPACISFSRPKNIPGGTRRGYVRVGPAERDRGGEEALRPREPHVLPSQYETQNERIGEQKGHALPGGVVRERLPSA